MLFLSPDAAWNWLLYWTGISNEAGKGYAFWSGFGSCLTYFSGIALACRRLKCHSPWCLRMGHHEAAGGVYKLCRKHHPDMPRRLTLGHIHRHHRQVSG